VVFTRWQSNPSDLKPGWTEWWTLTSGGTIVDVGFQNDGFKTDIVATQQFIFEQGKGLVQVYNTSIGTTVKYWAWMLIAYNSAEEAEADEIKAEVEEAEVESGDRG
jgi:hypothetical protein